MNIGGNFGQLLNGLLGDDDKSNDAENHDANAVTPDGASSGGGWFAPTGDEAANAGKDGVFGDLSDSLRNLFDGNTDSSGNVFDKLRDLGGPLKDAFGEGRIGDILKNIDAGNLEAGSDSFNGALGNMSNSLKTIMDGLKNADLHEAAHNLIEDIPTVRAELAEKAANGALSEADSHLNDVIATPLPPVLLQSLSKGGIGSLDLSEIDISSATERVRGILSEGARAHTENGLPSPDQEMEAGYAHIHEVQHAVQNELTLPENTAEEDHSYGL